MLYLYCLGCELACLALMGVSSMEMVEIHPGRMIVQILVWPLALLWWLAGRKRR